MKFFSASKITSVAVSGVILCAASLLVQAAPPERVPSFGPNGTHWPDLIATPFLYDEAALDIEVGPSWSAVESAIEGLTDAQANAGVRILIRPGSIGGKGSSSSASSVMNTLGKTSWQKRVTVCPRDGYGSVVLSGGHKFARMYNVCLAGFINTGGIMFQGCDGSSVAWTKTTYVKTISDLNPVSKVEFVEVVIPNSKVDNGDVSQVGAHTYQISNFRWDGCYFAPHYYVNNTTPRPHTDTLQFYKSGSTWDNWNMTIRDTAIFGSNNAALQTGGVDGIDIINSYIVNNTVSLSRYPVGAGGETDELNVAINGAGKNWTVVDTHMSGSAALSNPSGRFSDQPFVSVSNSTVSFGSNGLTEPQNGAWTRNTSNAFYIASMPPFPTDDYLTSIWSSDNVSSKVGRPVFSPSGGVYDSSQAVVITSSTPGAEIYYTTDGSTPNSNDTLYTTPVNVSSDTLLRAIAVDGGLEDSDIRTAEFIFKSLAPVISPSDAFFLESVEVVILSPTPGTTVYYTLDGSTPDSSDFPYTGPFELMSSANVKAIAVHPTLNDSEVVSSQLTIGESIVSSLEWSNFPLAPQNGVFAVTWNSIPEGNNMDGVTGISSGAANEFNDLACIARFAPDGTIDVRNGGSYQKDVTLNYSQGNLYNFLFIIDIPNKTYDVRVTPSGGAPVLIADDYAFRSQQSSVSELSNFSFIAPENQHQIEGVTLIENTPPSAPTGVILLGTE